MILFQKVITSEADVAEAVKASMSRNPTIFGAWGEQAIERYRQNLVESIGEKADTEVVFDPFLASSNLTLERLAATNANKRLSAWQHTMHSTRGFYTRKDPNLLSVQRCDYLDSWIAEWDEILQPELDLSYMKNAPKAVSNYMGKYGTGKVPKRVRLNKNFILGLYITWRKNGSLKSYHPLAKLHETLTQYGTNPDIAIALIQGDTLTVDKRRFLKEPGIHQLPLCDYKGDETSSPFVPGTVLEIVFEKVRTDEEADRLLFQARTHIGKFIRTPNQSGTQLHEIKGADKDEENEVYLKLDPQTAMEVSIPFNKDVEKPTKLPRYIRRNFFFRIPKESKNWREVMHCKGPRALKAAMSIRDIRLLEQRIQILVRTNRDGDLYLYLDDGYQIVNHAKNGMFGSNTEETWQRYLGRRKHPPKPAKPEAKHPFGSPDEVFARTSAQARQAFRVQAEPTVNDPMGYGNDFITDEVLVRPETAREQRREEIPPWARNVGEEIPRPQANTMVQQFMAAFAATAPTPPTEIPAGLTLEGLRRARDIMMGGRRADVVHDEVVFHDDIIEQTPPPAP